MGFESYSFEGYLFKQSAVVFVHNTHTHTVISHQFTVTSNRPRDGNISHIFNIPRNQKYRKSEQLGMFTMEWIRLIFISSRCTFYMLCKSGLMETSCSRNQLMILARHVKVDSINTANFWSWASSSLVFFLALQWKSPKIMVIPRLHRIAYFMSHHKKWHQFLFRWPLRRILNSPPPQPHWIYSYIWNILYFSEKTNKTIKPSWATHTQQTNKKNLTTK